MVTTDVYNFTSHLLRTTSAGEAKPWLDKLVAALCHVVHIELHPEFFFDTGATVTEHGKAVSPTTAAQCAEDIERSRVFMQGVYQAIQERTDRGQKVHLLYAGTGPFGLLVVPLLPFFSPSQLQVTLLDIHQQSLDCLGRLLDHLQVRDFVRAFRVEPPASVHITTQQAAHAPLGGG
jgi:hypothetical protein